MKCFASHIQTLKRLAYVARKQQPGAHAGAYRASPCELRMTGSCAHLWLLRLGDEVRRPGAAARSRRLRTLGHTREWRHEGDEGTGGRSAGRLPGAAWGAGGHGRAAEVAARVEPAKSARSCASTRVSTVWFLGSPVGCSGCAPRVNLHRARTFSLFRDLNQAATARELAETQRSGAFSWADRMGCVGTPQGRCRNHAAVRTCSPRASCSRRSELQNNTCLLVRCS